MITDGEPTAHITASGEVFFNYPPVRETVDATLREVVRCTRDDIRINTFMLDPTPHLRDFIEKISELNEGRAFFTTPETLGDYVLVDFIEQKRQMLRGRRAGLTPRSSRGRSGAAEGCLVTLSRPLSRGVGWFGAVSRGTSSCIWPGMRA